MSTFKPMDPELVWKAVEGYTNELVGESAKLESFYRQFACPRCGGAMKKEIDVRHTFADADTLVPRSLLRCTLCASLLDPHTGVQLELGNLGRAASGPVRMDPKR